jgi:hypothetical protein
VFSVPFDNTSGEGEEREITTHSHIIASVHFGPMLPHEDVSRENGLTTVFFNAQALPAAIPAVP